MPYSKLKYLSFALIAASMVIWGLLFGCVFQAFLGIPCPGCGMTRAWLEVLKGNFTAAFRWHPLFWAVPFLGFFAVFHKRFPSKAVFVTVLIFGTLILSIYFTRLFLFAPHTPPMTLNQNAFLWTVFGNLARFFSG